MVANQSPAKSFLNAIFPDHNKGKDVYYQGSRQMTSTSRRYYEKELGAGLGPSPGFSEHFGYTEPLRRFIQREGFEPQANEIPNEMPSWMPGDDYYTNFRVGDPYVKVDQGFARLPGAGYAALHPELKDVNPEDYPDINKMAILADVAPYSREYNTRSPRPAQQQNSRARGRGCRIPRDGLVGQAYLRVAGCVKYPILTSGQRAPILVRCSLPVCPQQNPRPCAPVKDRWIFSSRSYWARPLPQGRSYLALL